ncbi:MAG: DJ-1/PfpI family protein [Nanoarchaeota archaeon]|nr:DJ-1/PfpI family protein [Nanoarchaeota archaeon]
MASILMIIAPVNFRDEELLEPKKIFESAGHTVQIASVSEGKCKGSLGAEVKPDILVSKARADDYAAVIVVGGPGCPAFLRFPEVARLLNDAKAKNKVVASICIGGMILAKAGVLSGKKATVFKTAESVAAFQQGGAELMDKDVFVDGKFVTANGPQAAKEFAKQVLAAL